MAKKKKLSTMTAIQGVRFVQGVVEGDNCVFQQIALENDFGNDAYIEFFVNEESTSCCVWVQIKSGKSNVSSNGDLTFKSCKEDFEYWSCHILPVAGIVYDPTRHCAVWIDITKHLEENPSLIENGPYNIVISQTQQFDDSTFRDFTNHFLKYLDSYHDKLGLALQKCSNLSDQRDCYDGMQYLLTFQRQNYASWYYIISTYRNFRGHRILYYLTSAIAHLPGHPDIFWHKKNIINDETRNAALALLEETFGEDEILTMLEIVTDGGGFARGAIGQSVLAIIERLNRKNAILRSIFSDSNIQEDTRYWSIVLLAHFSYYKNDSEAGMECLSLIKANYDSFSDEDLRYMLEGVSEELQSENGFRLLF